MAIQAQIYNSENINIGFPFCGSFSSSSSPQELMMMTTTTRNMMENANANANVTAASAAACGGYGTGGFDQFYYKQPQQFQQQRNHNNNFLPPSSMPISVQVDKQRQEIDDYIKSQNERLRLLLEEQRKQQIETLLKKVETKASTLLRQKDEEISKYANRTMELELMLKRLEMENMAWQRMAHEYESMVFSLNTTLEQMREKAFFFNNNNDNNNGVVGVGVAEDAESCCDVDEELERHETEENRVVVTGCEKSSSSSSMVVVCKSCKSRDSCVLFLPCRHLCSCKACDAFLESCPLCFAPKKASIEALIS